MKIASIVALFLVGIVTAAGAVSAFGGMFRNSEADEAVENNDFAGWKAAMQDGLTEENFQEIVSRHQERGGMRGDAGTWGSGQRNPKRQRGCGQILADVWNDGDPPLYRTRSRTAHSAIVVSPATQRGASRPRAPRSVAVRRTNANRVVHRRAEFISPKRTEVPSPMKSPEGSQRRG